MSRPHGGYPCQYLLSKETNEEHIEELRTTTQYTAEGEDDVGGEVQQAAELEKVEDRWQWQNKIAVCLSGERGRSGRAARRTRPPQTPQFIA